MFTGIIQSVARIHKIYEKENLRQLEILFDENFTQGIEIGASIAIDGVCLTVCKIISNQCIAFDVMQQTLTVTTLARYGEGQLVNAERAATEGAEIGGHVLSGHVDFVAHLAQVDETKENYKLQFAYPEHWRKYIFPKGYISINGASLTISAVDHTNHSFDVWLIPETRKMTTFETKEIGDSVNIEIDRTTQVIVDTVERTLISLVDDPSFMQSPMIRALLNKANP